MATNRVDELFDIAAIDAQKAKIAAILNDIKTNLDDLQKLGKSIQIGGSISGSEGNTQKAAKALDEITYNVQEYNKLLKQNEALQAKINVLTSDAAQENVRLSKSYKELKAETDGSAKASRDAAAAKQAEKQAAKDAAAAKKEEAQMRQIEIAGTKEALAIQKELEKQKKATEAATRQEAKEQAIAAKNVFDLGNAYDVLNAKHKAAIKEYQNAAAAGKLSATEIKALEDRANDLGQQLFKIDTAVGNYRRNVGNYSSAWNGLGNSINQIAREMPNFAQSFQLGILAISNNLPILADEIKSAKDNIAALKAEGKSAPSLFSQITSSILSWQTALTVGITLIVAYGAEIIDWITSVSDAEKTQRRYEEALNDSIKAESSSIAMLMSAKNAINDTNTSRAEQNELLNEARKIAPEYLSNLSIEKSSLEEINDALDVQIKLLTERARQSAIQKTITDSTNELVLAQENLNKEYGFFEKVGAFFKTLGTDINELSKDAQAMALEFSKANVMMGKSADLTSEQLDKVRQLSNATNNLTNSLKLTSNALEQERDAIQKKIDANEEEIKTMGGAVKIGNSVVDYRKKEKEQLELNNIILKARIDLLDEEIDRQKTLAIQNERKLKGGDDELELVRIKARVAAAKNGSKEELKLKEQLIDQQLKIDKKRLREEYKGDLLSLQQNKEFKAREFLLEKEAEDAKERLIDSYIKKNKPKKEKEKKEQEKIAKDTVDIFLQISREIELIGAEEIANRERNLEVLRGELESGVISVQRYEKQKQVIVKNSEAEILRLQTERLGAILTELNLSEQDKQKVIQMFYDKSIDLSKKLTEAEEAELLEREKHRQNFDKNNQKSLDEAERREREANQLRRELAQETANFIFTLLDAQTQKEVELLEKQKEAVAEKYEQERNAIDAAFLADEEKAARKQVLDAEEAERQKVIDGEIRQKKRKAAILDKTQALTTIAINAALAKAAAFAPPPVGLGPVLGATLLPLILGLAAAQAATVIATPIPEYAKGKKETDSYEGLAIAGEKGTELMIDKDGKLSLLTQPTLINTRRGDRIFSNQELRQGVANERIAEAQVYDNTEVVRALGYGFGSLNSTIKNKKPDTIILDQTRYYDLQRAARR